jgi:ATP-dependent Clp protease adaptor protein ClpS
MSDTETATVIKRTTKKGAKSEQGNIGEVPRFQVILLNDDYTPMDFVVEVLQQIFLRSKTESVAIMLQVHRAGRGLAGVYSKQIAEAKLLLLHSRARKAGYPLKGILEELKA